MKKIFTIRTARAAGRRPGGVSCPEEIRAGSHALPLPLPEKSFCGLPGGSFPQKNSSQGPNSLLTTRLTVTVCAEGKRIGGQGSNLLARKRYQRGTVFLRNGNWVGRWREDEILDGRVRRVRRAEVLATREEIPTKRLALRLLEARLAVVNSASYRPRPTATFAQLAKRWEANVLPQFKPSTQATMRGHLRKYLVLFFGDSQLREMRAEDAQRFVSSVKASPKTVRNIVATLRLVWRSAKQWGYVAHDALEGIVLPRRGRARRRFFTLEELRRILGSAKEPERMFYRLAAETGMRSGEICGLRVDDLDLSGCVVHVGQSVWHGRVQSPKTETAYRAIAVSPNLAAHLRRFLESWRPNEKRLLFATRNGTPWDSNLLVKRKFSPLLRRLGIEHAGLHAFRHGSATLLDSLDAPMKIRQQRLGHSDVRMTFAYTHALGEDDSRVASQLGALLDSVGLSGEKKRVARIEQPIVVH